MAAPPFNNLQPKSGVDDGSSAVSALGDTELDRLNEALTGATTARLGPGETPTGAGSRQFSLPGYTIIREIHRGGQGIVFLAVQESTRRHVALKIAREGFFAGPEDKARFDREVQILARLKHPNIVTIHDSGRSGDDQYFVMDYIEGRPLDEHVLAAASSSTSAAKLPDMLRLYAKVCRAVDAAHALGFVHRDLKPNNILVTPAGEPFILDFGLAKSACATDTSEAGQRILTITGQFLGSVPWASPEQASGRTARMDARTDVYSLGVILYQLATGGFPYQVVGEVREVLDRIVSAAPVNPRSVRREIPRDVETIILRCLSKEAERRYADAGKLAADVERYLDGKPIEARRDSLRYVATRHSRRLLRRHPIVSTAAIVVISAVAAQELGGKVIYEWTALGQVSDRWLTGSYFASGVSKPFEHVRVIALTDDTPVVELAEAEGFTDVSWQNIRSVRRLHGALMKRLSRSGVLAVASAIGFADETPYDASLVEGVKALRDAHIRVVVCTSDWWLGGGKPGDLSSSIAPHVRWGCVTASLNRNQPWMLNLVAQRGHAEPLPSLALAALAAARHSDMEFLLSLDQVSRSVNISYWQPDAAIPNAKKWLSESDRIHLSGLSPETKDPSKGINLGDLIGNYIIDPPADDALAASTFDYREALRAEPAQLMRWFGGKVVVLGNLRAGVDRHPHPDGRTLPGCNAHAAAIDRLLSHSSIRRPPTATKWALTVIAAALGCGLVILIPSSGLVRGFALVGLFVLCAGASILTYRQFQYLCNPIVPLSSMSLGALSAWLSSKA